jgi:hypothetical protein
MLREIDRNIWVGEQPLKFWGFEVGTRMTVIRLANGEVIVISPIKVDEMTIYQINELGNVTAIVAPNLYHHLFVAEFKAIYPHAKIWAAPGLESKRPDIPIDKILNSGKVGITDEVEYLLFEGFKFFDLIGSSALNEIVFFHRESQTLILTDTAYHFDESFSLKTQLAFRFMGGYRKLEPSFLEKFATREKDKVKRAIKQVLCWDFDRVIMAHGSIIENDGKRKLKEGYEWFLTTTL